MQEKQLRKPYPVKGATKSGGRSISVGNVAHRLSKCEQIVGSTRQIALELFARGRCESPRVPNKLLCGILNYGQKGLSNRCAMAVCTRRGEDD
jgi:hypothetical protein